MHELHGWHGDRRHAPDAAADAPVTRARDAPKHEVLHDPEVRKAEFFKYHKIVEAAQAKYAAEQVKPREAQAERERPKIQERASEDRETKAALAEVDDRSAGLPAQAAKGRKPERSWLPSNETTQFAVSIGALGTTVSDALNIMPGKWDAVAASALAAVVTGVAWGNKRWKDRHGDRSQG
ncbi:MAG: hypothetical protein ACRDOI_20995 [Trebonia sp.]